MKTDDYQVVRSEADKLWSIFRKKYENLDWKWLKYLEDLGVERVCQYSHMMSPVSYLIERVNEGPFDKIIIHDPATTEDGLCSESVGTRRAALNLGDTMNELIEKIAKLMEEHKMRVYDFEFINELIEKTIERDQKECSY